MEDFASRCGEVQAGGWVRPQGQGTGDALRALKPVMLARIAMLLMLGVGCGQTERPATASAA
jgi:hypothetical protein